MLIFKEGFSYIYFNTNKLESILKEKRDELSNISLQVPGVGLEPTRTLRSTGF